MHELGGFIYQLVGGFVAPKARAAATAPEVSLRSEGQTGGASAVLGT